MWFHDMLSKDGTENRLNHALMKWDQTFKYIELKPEYSHRSPKSILVTQMEDKKN